MNQKDAEQQVLLLWSGWPNRSSPVTYQEKTNFYQYLTKFKPEVLEFRVRHGNDKWQVIQAWLANK